jgi:predicted DNA binding protein
MTRDADAFAAQLTARERTVLLTALEYGYFEVPRETSLVTIGRELGMSDREVSRLVRRGTGKVLSVTRERLEAAEE